MMTEEELRHRLHDATAGFAPHDDLLDSLADRYSRKHKRVRRGLIGGSVAATLVVATLLGTLFTSSPPPAELDPAAMSEAEIIQKAREADANAQDLIMHFTTTGGGWPESESWAIRSANRGRLVQPGVRDYAVTPDSAQDIDYARRVYTVVKGNFDQVVGHVAGAGVGDPAELLRADNVRVVNVGTEIQLAGRAYVGAPAELWLDRKTFLPARAKIGVLDMTFRWLPATSENLKLLENTVPPDFKQSDTSSGPRLPGEK